MGCDAAADRVCAAKEHDQRGSNVVQLGRSPEAQALAKLLCSAPPDERRALFALAVSERLQLGVLKAGLEFWPNEVPTSTEIGKERRHG